MSAVPAGAWNPVSKEDFHQHHILNSQAVMVKMMRTWQPKKIKRQSRFLLESTLFIISELTSWFAPSPYHFLWTLSHEKIRKRLCTKWFSWVPVLTVCKGSKWYANINCTRWISPCFSQPNFKRHVSTRYSM